MIRRIKGMTRDKAKRIYHDKRNMDHTLQAL